MGQSSQDLYPQKPPTRTQDMKNDSASPSDQSVFLPNWWRVDELVRCTEAISFTVVMYQVGTGERGLASSGGRLGGSWNHVTMVFFYYYYFLTLLLFPHRGLHTVSAALT